ncbi:hypothetical protein EJB05_51838, partial [Eragrostis curvula]
MEIARALIYSKFNETATVPACDVAKDPIKRRSSIHLPPNDAITSIKILIKKVNLDVVLDLFCILGVLGMHQYLELHTRPTIVYRENEQSHFPLRICDQIIMDEALEV